MDKIDIKYLEIRLGNSNEIKLTRTEFYDLIGHADDKIEALEGSVANVTIKNNHLTDNCEDLEDQVSTLEDEVETLKEKIKDLKEEEYSE